MPHSPFSCLTSGRHITTTEVPHAEQRGLSPSMRHLHLKTSREPKGYRKPQLCSFLSLRTEAAIWKVPRSYMKMIHWLIKRYVLEFSPDSSAGRSHFSPFLTLILPGWSDVSMHHFWHSINLANIVHPTLAYPWGLTQANSPLKQLLPCHIHWAASVGTTHIVCLQHLRLGLTASHTEGLLYTPVSPPQLCPGLIARWVRNQCHLPVCP